VTKQYCFFWCKALLSVIFEPVSRWRHSVKLGIVEGFGDEVFRDCRPLQAVTFEKVLVKVHYSRNQKMTSIID
jgi:hypothetical protein